MLTASRQLSIFDTTLRDGEQAPGNAMAPAQKLRLAQELERLGVDVIEAGFPAASDNDFAAVRSIAEQLRLPKICVFARAMKGDLETAIAATERARRVQVEILASASAIHLKHKRGISPQQALDETAEATEHARYLGFTDICVAPEDATRADRVFLRKMCLAAVQAGATMIGIPDTVGACLPDEIGRLVTEVRGWLPPEVKLAIHTHDDLGLAVANTLAAIEHGVDEVQVTLCGIGERAGNAALEEVVAALVARPERFGRLIAVDSTRLYAACQALIREINLPLARGKAVIGENAFATAAGLHQAGILRAPITYEFLDPSVFGAERRMVFSRHSGRHAIRAKLETLGLPADEGSVSRVYAALAEDQAPHRSVWSDSEIRATLELVP